MKKFFLTLTVALVAMSITPELAHAGSTASDVSGFNSTIGKALCEVAAAMTGTLGQGLATIAVLMLGIGAFFGKVNWGLAVTVAVGIAAIFGAASIVGVIGATNESGDGCENINAT